MFSLCFLYTFFIRMYAIMPLGWTFRNTPLYLQFVYCCRIYIESSNEHTLQREEIHERV